MLLKDKDHLYRLSDQELDQVAGGRSTVLNERGEEMKEGRFVTSTLTSYASGTAPKFSVGDSVKIKWRIGSSAQVLCNAEVVGVSSGKAAGLLFRKYTYNVRILTCPNSDMLGLIESDVHENCLFL